jgi:hypothetical protein
MDFVWTSRYLRASSPVSSKGFKIYMAFGLQRPAGGRLWAFFRYIDTRKNSPQSAVWLSVIAKSRS